MRLHVRPDLRCGIFSSTLSNHATARPELVPYQLDRPILPWRGNLPQPSHVKTRFMGNQVGTALPWVWVVMALVAPPVVASAPSQLQLRADVVTVREAGQTIEARGQVRITDGRSEIRAGRAVYTVRERRIVLTGGVVAKTSEGDLQASQATVHLGKTRTIDIIEAVGDVVVEAQRRVLKAQRMTYAVSTAELVATGQASLFVPPDLIASAGELVARRDVATLSGRARVQNRDGFLEGDRLQIQQRTQTAELVGNVVGVFQETRIASEAATLLASEQKIIFRNRVSITRPGQTMNAEKVTLYYRENRLVAEGSTYIRIEEPAPGP